MSYERRSPSIQEADEVRPRRVTSSEAPFVEVGPQGEVLLANPAAEEVLQLLQRQEKSEQQRKDLRALLLAIGVSVLPDPSLDDHKVTEEHLAPITVAAEPAEVFAPTELERLGAIVEEAVTDEIPSTEAPSPLVEPEAPASPAGEIDARASSVEVQTPAPDTPRPVPRPESVESAKVFTFDQSVYESLPAGGEQFARNVIARYTYIKMKDGALVLDRQNQVRAMVPVQTIGDAVPGMGYPEYGYVTEGYAKAWKEAALETSAERLNVPSAELEVAYNWNDLRAGQLKLGERPESLLEVTTHFAELPVSEEGMTRLEYTIENLDFQNDDLPESLVASLKQSVIGIPGEESRFNDQVVSGVGARTAFQIMPATFAELGYGTYEDYPEGVPFSIQVKAFGKHIGNIYRELTVSSAAEDLAAVRALFPGDETFYEQFMTALMIDAYHAGSGNVRAALSNFTKSDEFAAMKEGKQSGLDVYVAMSQMAAASQEGPLANYGVHSERYVYSVYAFATAFHETASYTLEVADAGNSSGRGG